MRKGVGKGLKPTLSQDEQSEEQSKRCGDEIKIFKETSHSVPGRMLLTTGDDFPGLIHTYAHTRMDN